MLTLTLTLMLTLTPTLTLILLLTLTLTLTRRVLPALRALRREKQRPNVYAWCYADEELCVASGSSGAVTVWQAV